MSDQPSIPLDLHLHINDLHDILASITLDQSACIESVWYEFWDSVLNYWIRRSSDGHTRLSLAPQRQIIREILSDDNDIDADANWSFEADPGDASMVLSSSPPGIPQRIFEANVGVDVESSIPDFTAFALRCHGMAHRRLVCIIEIKPQAEPLSFRKAITIRQIVTQAKFAFDSFPDLLHVLTILALGDSWCMYRFPRHELNQLYHTFVEGYEDHHNFDPARASSRPRIIDVGNFIVIPSSHVLNDDGSNYSAAFEQAIELVVAGLK